ncbi:hypothetical protein N0V88_006744 [Collariella sp. IMI 366227]|nr:hypothetical protein N0V88_006744 [Collariella sp. IMI 366227]
MFLTRDKGTPISVSKEHIAKFQKRKDIAKFRAEIQASTDRSEKNKLYSQIKSTIDTCINLQFDVDRQAYFEKAGRLRLQGLEPELTSGARGPARPQVRDGDMDGKYIAPAAKHKKGGNGGEFVGANNLSAHVLAGVGLSQLGVNWVEVRPKAATTSSTAQQNQPARPPAAALSSTETFPSGIKLLHNAAHATVDIVFVHGLTGDREKTWTASNASEPWPKALLPSELPTARVLTFGYDAYVADWRGMVSQNRIANHAWNLLTSLVSYRERDDTRTEPHLHNVLRLTGGIAFLGTPHHGSGLARWAELLSRSIGIIKQTNTQIVEVLKRDSEVLSRIQDGFHTMVLARGKEGQPIEISCFFEELPLPGIGQVSMVAWPNSAYFADGVGQVVPQDSAVLPGYIPIGIHGNHMDMTKFASADDPGFQAVCGELRRWLKQLGKAAPPDENLPLSEPSSVPKDGKRGPGESDRLDGLQRDAAIFLVPYTCNPDFVGRSGILEKLKDQLGHKQRQSKWHLRAALYGLGGIG